MFNARVAVLCLYSPKFERWVEVQRKGVAKYAPSADYIAISEEHLRRAPWALQKYADKGPQAYLCSNRPKAVIELLRQGYERVVFVGADIYFTAPLLLELAQMHWNVAITPHVCSPPVTDGRAGSIQQVLRTGLFNSDLVIWRNTSAVECFLHWQATQLEIECKANLAEGHFFDQPYLTCLMSYPGIELSFLHEHNVAYYNLHENVITKGADGQWMCGKYVLKSFQFTGYEPETMPTQLSKYNGRPELVTRSVLELLMEFYNELENVHDE